MSLNLGGKLELKDVDVRTSTVEGQKLFLQLILEMRPEVVWDLTRLFNDESLPSKWLDSQEHIDTVTKSVLMYMLRDFTPEFSESDLDKVGLKGDYYQTPLWAYYDFIHKNKEEFNELYSQQEKQWNDFSPNSENHLIANSTLREMIPDWQSLRGKPHSEELCKLVEEWGLRWNLTDEWCLTFALQCLREFKVHYIDLHTFEDDFFIQTDYTPMFLNEFYHKWRTRFGWSHALFFYDNEQAFRDTYFTIKIADYPYFTFKYIEEGIKRRIEAFCVEGRYDPITMQPEDFRKRMHKQFLKKFGEYYQLNYTSLVGNLRDFADKLIRFENSINSYVEKAEKKVKPFASKTIKKEDDKHFRWLIRYQIPPEKSYTQLFEDLNLDFKTVHQAIGRTSELINLTLRKSKKSGRKKGAKDWHKRERRKRTV